MCSNERDVCGAYEVAVASGIHSFFLTINIAAFPSTNRRHRSKTWQIQQPAKEVLDYSLSFRLRWRQRLPIYAALELEVAPMALTKRQKEVLDYLVAFETKHGYAPSFEEIGKGLKLTSLATVHKHITTLEKKDFIRRGYNQSRSIEIVQLPKSVKDQLHDRKMQELPLVGRITAEGPLGTVEENETVLLDD